MKTPHKYPSMEQLRELVKNAPIEGKASSTKRFLEQEELKMPKSKYGYDGFDSLLISNFSADISSFRF